MLVSSIALMIFDEDALEKWCNKCCFRLQPSHKSYAKDAEELEDLFSVISEII